jgi:D-aspartate ligase
LNPPAVLLGGGLTALAVARSLTRAGVRVFGLGAPGDPLRYSRCRDEFIDVGQGADFQAGCLDWLERGPRGGVLIPCDDEALELVAVSRDRLVELGYAPTEADDGVVLSMLDKQRAYELAHEAGIETPRSATVASAAEARAAAAEIGYPCALKPRRAHRFRRHLTDGAPGQGKAFAVHDEADLDSHLDWTPGREVELIVTEIIPGPDSEHVSYYGYLDSNGESLFHVTKRKLRQHPPGFGTGCYHVTEWLPDVAELGLRLLRELGVRGLACPEFKRDERDGRLKFIECNHRFTMATEQLRASGADLPVFVYRRTLGLPTPRLNSYRTGLGFWYPLRDVRAFMTYRRNGELTFAEWGRSLLRPQRFPAASLRDPVPTLAGAARKATRLPKLVRGRRE